MSTFQSLRLRVAALSSSCFLLLGAAQAQQSLLVNGSFENGPAVGGYLELPVGSTAISGWTVVFENIDYIGGSFVSSEGGRSVDLGATASAGGVSQTVATVPGNRYRVEFDLAGNPRCAPVVKQLRVEAAGASALFLFDTSGKTPSNMGWVRHTWDFVATSATTTLSFRSLISSNCGAAVDHVVLREADFVLSATNLNAGQTGTLHVTGASPNGLVGLAYSLTGGGPSTVAAGSCGAVTVAMSLPVKALPFVTADANGEASYSRLVPAGMSGRSIWLQALDFTTCAVSNGLAETFG